MNWDRLCLGCLREGLDGGECVFCHRKAGFIQQPPYALPAGTILHGRYLTGAVLGHGGFGITYLALDLADGRRTAVKEYLPGGLCTRKNGETQVNRLTDEEDFQYGLGQFLQEARMIYECRDTPGIIRVEKLFEENQTAYYIMEYLEGRDLKQYLKEKGGSLSFEETKKLLSPVGWALERVHRKGIVHRDISPDNIFLCSDGSVRLLDFGAARVSLMGKSQSVDVILKRGYAPEEQYRSHGRQGPWTDVYAFASTYYHCLTGRIPPEATQRVREDSLVLPEILCPELPVCAARALRKAMAVYAEDRYQSVGEFQAALDGKSEKFRGERLGTTKPESRQAEGWGGRIQGFLQGMLFKTDGKQKAAPPVLSSGENQFSRQPPENGGVISAGIWCAGGVFAGNYFPLEERLVIGRNGMSCHLVFPPGTPGVSGTHCELYYDPEKACVVIQDLGSSWGTCLGGETVLAAGQTACLCDGDQFMLGDGNVFQVVIRKGNKI